MKLEITVSEISEIIKTIQEGPERIFEMIRFDVRESVGKYLSEMMGVELSHFLKREYYEHGQGAVNHRNGHYCRNFTLKGVGSVDVKVPRDRWGEFRSQVLPRSKRYEEDLAREMGLLFLSGVSTRSLSMMSERLIGRKISPSEISSTNKELTEAAERWRGRDLSQEDIKYLFIDGVNFSMRLSDSVEKVPVLVAIGVNTDGHKSVLGFQSGDKESSSSWREFFKDLKSRGLDGQQVELGIMDGLPGLEVVFKEEFPEADVQRCQVHVARNVLAKVPKKYKEFVADDLRSIFYASSREKAEQFYKDFKQRWSKILPSAVSCLERHLESCLTFFDYPCDEWISLRTTNIIERLNKEFKRRTKVMEILAGETSCYLILAYVSLRMELHWRSNPVGRVRKNLPFFNALDQEKFTQEN